MSADRSFLTGLVVAIAIALIVPVIYFAVSGNWTNLGNPIASIVAIVAGLAGFAAGARLSRQRGKP